MWLFSTQNPGHNSIFPANFLKFPKIQFAKKSKFRQVGMEDSVYFVEREDHSWFPATLKGQLHESTILKAVDGLQSWPSQTNFVPSFVAGKDNEDVTFWGSKNASKKHSEAEKAFLIKTSVKFENEELNKAFEAAMKDKR